MRDKEKLRQMAIRAKQVELLGRCSSHEMVTELNPIKMRPSKITSMWLVSASIEGPSVSNQNLILVNF